MTVFPLNRLGDFNKLQGRFFNPKLLALQQFNQMGKGGQDDYVTQHRRPLQASSLHSHLLIVLNFMETILKKGLFCGIQNKRFDIYKSNTCKITKQLNRAIMERKVEYRQIKSKNLLTKSQLLAWGKSCWVKSLMATLQKLHKNVTTVSTLLETSIRDHIMFLLTITSGLRSSNLMELTLKDVAEIKDDEHIWHKGSYMCPTKYLRLKIYVDVLRPMLLKDEVKNCGKPRDLRNRLLFITQDANPEEKMKQSVIAKCVKRAVVKGQEKSEISEEQINMLSPSTIRASIATMLHKAGKIENLKHFCNSFVKHNPKTGLKHYILEGAATEKVLQYTMDVVDVFGLGVGRKPEDMKILNDKFENVSLSKTELHAGISSRLSTISTENGQRYDDDKLISHINSIDLGVDFEVQPSVIIEPCVAAEEESEEEEEEKEWDGAEGFRSFQPGDYVFRTFNKIFDRRHTAVLAYILRYKGRFERWI